MNFIFIEIIKVVKGDIIFINHIPYFLAENIQCDLFQFFE